MSDEFGDLYDDDAQETQEQGPKPLRDALKKANAEIKKRDERLAKLEKQFRDTTVTQFVQSKGLDEKVVGLIGENDPQEWFDTYGALFGAAKEAETQEKEEVVDTSPKGQSALTPEQLAAIQQVASIMPGQFTPETTNVKMAELDSATSKEDFFAKAKGIPIA